MRVSTLAERSFPTPTIDDLSEKQREVLDLVLDRRTNKEIAALLGISASAVEQRLQSVRRRLGVVSRADLARAYQDLLEACQKHTGEKLQVADKSVAAQKSSGVREVPASPFGPGQAGRTGGVGRRWDDVADAHGKGRAEKSGTDEGSRLLQWLDRVAGMPGRLAAITVTATSLAFLLAIVTRLLETVR